MGTGELAIRLSLANNVVNSLKHGLSINQSVEEGIKELYTLNEDGVIQILSMDKDGNVAACSNSKLHYTYASSEDPIPQRIDTYHLSK